MLPRSATRAFELVYWRLTKRILYVQIVGVKESKPLV